MSKLVALIAVAWFLTTAGAADDPVKVEMAKFEGTWQLHSAVTDGKETPEETVAKVRVVIKAGKHSVYFGPDAVAKEIAFAIDPTKSPKTVDDTLTDGKVIKGIYKLDGDTLTSCVAEVGKERPTEFAAKVGSGHTLRVFKRVKENEAEAAYRKLERKLLGAKAMRVRFDAVITVAADKKGSLEGTLLFGDGDKYRQTGEGKMGGEPVKFTAVSDGTTIHETVVPAPSEKGKNESPKGLGRYYRGSLPHTGVFLSLMNAGRREKVLGFALTDFKFGKEEKIGERKARSIEFTVTPEPKLGPEKNDPDPQHYPTKLWLDSETGLPLKFAMSGGISDIKSVTETYAEFAIDPEVDAKEFELPKK